MLGFFSHGFHLLDSLDLQYDSPTFVRHTHSMYLEILVQRYQTSHVLRQVPVTPIQVDVSSFISVSSDSPSKHSDHSFYLIPIQDLT